MYFLYKKFLFFLLLIAFLFIPHIVKADTDFKSDYTVEYFLNDQNPTVTHVKLTIAITNLQGNVIIRKIGISFPKTLSVSNIKASDNKGTIDASVSSDTLKSRMELIFSDPDPGKNITNTFNVEFDQENILKISGNVWEVTLPTVEDDTRNSYRIIAHLPSGTQKKISISKPKPDSINGNTIVWNNPSAKTIYATFGSVQYYQMKIAYHLENTELISGYTDIALPPDTSYQKTYLESINPKPTEVFMDNDNNLLARYVLKPKQKLDILYSGIIEVNNQARQETNEYFQKSFEKQKDYLLSQQKYWELTPDKIPAANTPKDIFSYVATTLKYNYAQVNDNLKRLGAEQALITPDKAVCVEFADTFVAIAREKGIYSREVEGYAFSQDAVLRPLSLVTDVLHAWPEYFDTEKKVWVQIDPTWENTSGIDYFSSFDLDHITFVNHGEKSNYPDPAGSYKTEQSKDIVIRAVDQKPQEKVNIQAKSTSVSNQIADNSQNRGKVNIVNQSNVYLWNVPVTIESTHLNTTLQTTMVDVIPPYGTKDILFTYSASEKNTYQQGSMKVLVGENTVYQAQISIIPFYMFIIAYGIGAIMIIGILIGLFSFLKKLRFRKNSVQSPETNSINKQ